MEDNMKKTKKLLSLLLALVMMLGVFAPLTVLANNANTPVEVPTGKLEADQLSETKPEKTEIDIFKLTTKQNYKDGAPWEHTGGKISDPSILGTDVTPLAGAKFTFYKVNVKVNADTTDTTGKEAKTQAEADKLNEKYLNILKDYSADFDTVEKMQDVITKGYTKEVDGQNGTKVKITIPAGVLELAEGEGLTKGQTEATTAAGLATVKLADGYYWAVESVKPDKVTSAKAVPFGLTLPLMNGKAVGDVKAGSQYLKKIYIYPKNIQTDNVQIDKNHGTYDKKTGKWIDSTGKEIPKDKLGIDYDQYQRKKEVVSEELGKDTPFQSDTTIPRNYTFDSFSWVDTMSEGLTYNKDLEVTIDYTDADGKTIKEKQPFINAGNKSSYVTERDNGFDIKVTKSQVADTLVEYLKRGPVTFHFSYSAKVNNKTVVDKPQTNSITFKPGEPTGVPDVKSSNGEIEITKSWKKNNENVTTPTAKDLTYYVEDANGKTVASVTVKSDAAAGTVIQAANGITFTVGANFGSGTFKGLPEGSYKVREAVNGYEPTYTKPEAVPGSDAQAPAGKLDIENNDKPEVKKPSEPKVVFHGKKFVKMDQLGNETRLFGAEFVIRRETATAGKYEYLVVKDDTQKVSEVEAVKTAKKNLDDKIAAYNALTAKEQEAQKATYEGEIATLQDTYNKAVIAARTQFDWGTKDDAYVLVSDEQGRFEITGLKAGDYELEEITAPAGYALIKGGVKFTVKDGTYTGKKYDENQAKFLEEAADGHIQYNKDDTKGDYGQRVDNKKVTIPQTGGIGTVIFTAVGVALMAGAVIAMKKNREEA